MPEVAPKSGTAALDYHIGLSAGYSVTARLETTYTGQRYSLAFPNPYEATGTYIQILAYKINELNSGAESYTQIENCV
jgi:hypothetical protein